MSNFLHSQSVSIRCIVLDQLVVLDCHYICVTDYQLPYYSIAGGDFTSFRRTVIFNIGVVSARVEVTILDDTTIESTETFTASLTTTEGNVVIANGIATVSILDDFDGELSFQLLALPLLVKIIYDTFSNLPGLHMCNATCHT